MDEKSLHLILEVAGLVLTFTFGVILVTASLYRNLRKASEYNSSNKTVILEHNNAPGYSWCSLFC